MRIEPERKIAEGRSFLGLAKKGEAGSRKDQNV